MPPEIAVAIPIIQRRDGAKMEAGVLDEYVRSRRTRDEVSDGKAAAMMDEVSIKKLKMNTSYHRVP
jgi:hypothetical protein